MSESEQQDKILACGSVNGQFSRFVKRITSVNKKNGPFNMVLCCGRFFSSNDPNESQYQKLIKGELNVPIPVYILGPATEEQSACYSSISPADGGEICNNVICLGKKGVFKTASGLQIAYLSGTEDIISSKSFCYSKFDVNDLINRVEKDEKFKGVDVLMTSLWPKHITKYVKTEAADDNASSLVAHLATKIKPRYHFSASNKWFLERPPYRNHQVLLGEQEHVSRFISLAPFANESNKKYIYAFSIMAMSLMKREDLIKQTDDTTESPYKSVISESNMQNEGDKPKSFFFDDHSGHGRKRQHDKDGQKREKKIPKGPPVFTGPCWFCLGSKEVEKHLIISVGEHSYLALAKGPLTPSHVLICPVSHYNSAVLLPDEVLMEMERYKRVLREMFHKMDHSVVIFERNFYTQHLQLQVIPVPNNVDVNLPEVFSAAAQLEGMEVLEMPEDTDLKEMVQTTTPYFFVEFDNGIRLLHRVKSKMPLHFGREVIACSVLDMPDRVNWKSCKQSKEEEKNATKRFRQIFKPYDFNFT